MRGESRIYFVRDLLMWPISEKHGLGSVPCWFHANRLINRLSNSNSNSNRVLVITLPPLVLGRTFFGNLPFSKKLCVSERKH